MKVIISHDVDHLFRDDHYKDLIYPKIWIRETLSFLQHKITFREWCLRVSTTVQKVRHHIDEVMEFDCQHGVPSTFFFGMTKGLGMSYKKERAVPVILNVRDNGFEVGLHGVAFEDLEEMQQEYQIFKDCSGQVPAGLRMHYVRHKQGTFEKLSQCGYCYDSTEFDKIEGCCVKAPYKVKAMWEFPLTIMDSYLPYSFPKAKERTLELLKKAEENKIGYVCILFHDYQYSDAYSQTKKWYEWVIRFLEQKKGYQFISYQDAIIELEERNQCRM